MPRRAAGLRQATAIRRRQQALLAFPNEGFDEIGVKHAGTI
jgi:hypothetical protein